MNLCASGSLLQPCNYKSQITPQSHPLHTPMHPCCIGAGGSVGGSRGDTSSEHGSMAFLKCCIKLMRWHRRLFSTWALGHHAPAACIPHAPGLCWLAGCDVRKHNAWKCHPHLAMPTPAARWSTLAPTCCSARLAPQCTWASQRRGTP